MAGVNKVIIIGRLGNDPEVRTMPNGDLVANISVATSETWNDKNTGERKEVTEWHRIVFYRRQAEICGQYLKKGAQIYVEGKLRTRKWQDQNGQDRYTTEIQGESLQMLGGNQQGEQSQAPTQPTQASKNNYAAAKNGSYSPPPAAELDDDIPF